MGRRSAVAPERPSGSSKLPTRRQLLGLGAGSLAAAALPNTALAAGDSSWDISYLWSRSLDNALDYREIVADALGPEVARDLVVVHGYGGHWGVICDRTTPDAAAATSLAADHHRILRERLGGREVMATALLDRGYTRLHHVAYGTVGSEEEARHRYDRIVELLGAEVHADLVIEQSAEDAWQVTWKQYADRETVEAAAATHAARLLPHDIPAQVVVDRNLDLRWGASSGAEATTEAPARSIEPPVAAKIAVNKTLPASPAQAREEAGDRELPAAIATPVRDAINEHVQALRRKRMLSPDETTSWYVHSLHDDRTWAAINGELKLQCASMVKPYIALAFLHRVSEKKLIYGKVSRSKLEAMIQHSDNRAANWAIDTLGGPAQVQRILAANYGHVLQETSITESIPADGRTYRNRSSARDYVRFSRALWRDELAGSEEIRRLMALPGRDRLLTGARGIPSCTRVLNKTGTTSHLCGDFGILVAKDRQGKDVPYAIVGIVEKSSRAKDFGAWVATRGDVIRSVSDLAYRMLQKQYSLA
jgi:beta-lactamase class A